MVEDRGTNALMKRKDTDWPDERSSREELEILLVATKDPCISQALGLALFKAERNHCVHDQALKSIMTMSVKCNERISGV